MISLSGTSFSLYASFCSNSWHWFQRSGSLLVICGVYLGARGLFRKRLKESIYSETHTDHGHINPTEEERLEQILLKWDIRFAYFGALLALLGTLISAYGDLLGKI